MCKGSGTVEITEASVMDDDDYDDSDAYTTPKYHELSEELQDGLTKYLSNNYIDDALVRM